MAEETRYPGTTISRRELVERASVGVGGLLVAGALPAGWLRVQESAEAANALIKIGFISPRTGPLGSFGEPDPYALSLFRKKLAKGLRIKGKLYDGPDHRQGQPVEPSTSRRSCEGADQQGQGRHRALDVDAGDEQPGRRRMRGRARATHLAPSSPGRRGISARGATPGKPSPFHWGFHMSFGVEDFFTEYVSNWNGAVKTNKKVGVMWPNDADGQAVRAVLTPLLTKAGFTVVDPGPYEDGTTDYTAQITKFKQENCQIFNTFPIPPDFTTFWQQAAQQGYTRLVKIAQLAKTGLFPSQIEASGALGYNLASNVYWHPTFPYSSPFLGLSSKQLAAGYEIVTKKQWNQQLGATVSLLDVAIAALKRTANPKSKPAFVKTMRTLKTDTTVGRLDWTKNPKDPTGRRCRTSYRPRWSRTSG